MDRISTLLVAAVLAGLIVLPGCANNKKKPADTSASATPAPMPGDQAATPTVTNPPPAAPPAAGAAVPIGPDTSAEPAPVGPAPKAAAAGGTYVIKKGDTFYKIARAVYHDVKMVSAIEKANPGVDPTHLKIGQKIKLP